MGFDGAEIVAPGELFTSGDGDCVVCARCDAAQLTAIAAVAMRPYL